MAGRYRLEGLIGRGGMGEVWRAHDEVLNRLVALKSAPTGDDRSADRLKQSLVREARNAAQPHHPHIVEVFDFVVEDGTCWIVMEYVPARSLAQIIADGPLSPARVAAIGRQLADALAVSHAPPVGVVHGDLTPENVLVRDDGVAKLTDFGISRAIWSDPTVDVTGTGGVRGKPRYLPPELARGRPSTEKSDVFSLGATLYAAVEGRSPYGEADNPMAYLGRALAAEIEPPRRAGPLTKTLTALLDPDPKRRPSAAGARDMLGRLAPATAPGGQPGGDDAPTWSVTLPLLRHRRLGLRWPRAGRRKAPLAIGGTAVAVAAAVVAGIILWGPGGGGGSDGTGGGATPGTSVAAHAGVLGDPRTADPCGLLSTAPFDRYGDAHIDPAYGEFNRCDVLVGQHDEDLVDVEAAFSTGASEPDSQSDTHKAGRLTVIKAPEKDDACDRVIQLLDGHQIDFTVKRLEKTSLDVCTLADKAAAHATDLLNRGPVPRRRSPFPPDSLAKLDACALLDADAAKGIPGLDPQGKEPDIAHWDCTWDSNSAEAGLELLFSRDNDLTNDGRPLRLGGAQSYLSPAEDGPHTCTVRTVYRVYTDAAGDHVVEHLYLEVHGTESTDKLCGIAKSVATGAVKKTGRR